VRWRRNRSARRRHLDELLGLHSDRLALDSEVPAGVIEMLYSKTVKYAVLALAEIARRTCDGAIPTRAVAEGASVPYSLLAKILVRLKAYGIVVVLRGKNGGIRLARPSGEITIRDVVVALDGPGVFSDCPLHLSACACEKECAFHPIWKPARDGVARFLETTTIRDVADAHEVQVPPEAVPVQSARVVAGVDDSEWSDRA